jgi:hypothetical protein
MGWPDWLRNLLHIETLFLLGVTITIFYFIWKYRSPRQGLARLEEIAGDILLIPKDMVSRRGAKRGAGNAPRVNRHEERCRQIFEEIFEKKFKSIRPDWLKNPITKRNLELDGLCEDIKTPIGRGLAFEYDGAQHSRYIPGSHFHRRGPMEFVYQVKKDSWKDVTCKNRGILLIRIPSFVPYDDLERYIKQQLRKYNMGRYVTEYNNLAPGISNQKY